MAERMPLRRRIERTEMAASSAAAATRLMPRTMNNQGAEDSPDTIARGVAATSAGSSSRGAAWCPAPSSGDAATGCCGVCGLGSGLGSGFDAGSSFGGGVAGGVVSAGGVVVVGGGVTVPPSPPPPPPPPVGGGGGGGGGGSAAKAAAGMNRTASTVTRSNGVRALVIIVCPRPGPRTSTVGLPRRAYIREVSRQVFVSAQSRPRAWR